MTGSAAGTGHARSDAPTITVGLPIAGESKGLVTAAISSVLNQTFQDWELIVVADGAPKDMVDYLRTFEDPRIRIVAHDVSAGLGARLNEIAGLASGEYLARFDADDVMVPTRLEYQLRRARELGVDVLSGGAIIIDEETAIVGRTPAVTPEVTVDSMFAATPLIHPTVFARRDWFVRHPYDAQWLRCQDKALWITSAADSTFYRDAEPVLFYRVARNLNPKKYARSVRFERRIIRRYGPAEIGTLRTWATVGRSYAKQLVVDIAAFAGRGSAVISRRYVTLDSDASEIWQSQLDDARRRAESTEEQ